MQQLVLELAIGSETVVVRLLPPAVAQFFSFDRYAAALTQDASIPVWLYSVYGYLLGDQAILIRYYAHQELEHLVLPRPVAFPW